MDQAVETTFPSKSPEQATELRSAETTSAALGLKERQVVETTLQSLDDWEKNRIGYDQAEMAKRVEASIAKLRS